MDIKELLEKQKKLGHTILNNYSVRNGTPIDKKQLLSDTLLALTVESSELANATKCFKYWSQKPSENKEILLEEYSDILQILLCIGNQLGFTAEDIEAAYLKKHEINYQRQIENY